MREVNHADPFAIVLITLAYVIFAIQVAVQVDWKTADTRSVKSLGSLIVVFVLCALSGYLSTLFLDYAGVPLIRELMHWLLVGASWTLVLTNQGKIIADLLKRRD